MSSLSPMNVILHNILYLPALHHATEQVDRTFSDFSFCIDVELIVMHKFWSKIVHLVFGSQNVPGIGAALSTVDLCLDTIGSLKK